MDDLYETWALETSYHKAQRRLQLDMMREKRNQTQQRMLDRRELFPVNKLKAQRRAEAVQRACDQALQEEIVFLPQLPAARQLAQATWARDPLTLSKVERAVAQAEVGELREAISAMASIGLRRKVADKGVQAFKHLGDRKGSSKEKLGLGRNSSTSLSAASGLAESHSSGSLGKGKKADMQ